MQTYFSSSPAGSPPAANLLPPKLDSSSLSSFVQVGPPAGYARTTEATLHTHLNSALAGAMVGSSKTGSSSSSKGKRQGTGKERSLNLGNDETTPWYKVPSSRNVEIRTVETFATSPIITSSGIPAFASLAFIISSVTDFTAFSAVFDQYKIEMIEVLIEPSVTEVSVASTGDVGEITSVIDIDDANVPTSLADLGSYTSVVQTKGTQSHYHRWVPSVAVAVYSGAFTSFAASTSLWLDCGSPSIQHYGLKVGTSAASQVQTYYIQAKLHCAWRARH